MQKLTSGDKQNHKKKEFKLSRWTIKLKLLGIISFIFILSVSTMILLATYFFRRDSKVRIVETSLKIADTVGSKVKSDFSYIIEKINLLLLTNVQEFKTPEQKKTFIDLFFKNDKDFLMVGVFTKEGDKLISETTLYNLEFLKEYELLEFDIDKTVTMHSRNFLKSFAGKPSVNNVSIGVKIPIFAISFPLKEQQDKIVVGIFHTDKIKDSFVKTKGGISETYLVNDQGDVIAHPDEKLLVEEKNLFDSEIVKAMLTSKFDNGQKTYKDKYSGIKYIGAYKKIGFAGVGVISVVPEEKALAEVYNIQRRNILIMVITLCMAFLVIYNFSNTLTKPLLMLVGATKEIESGNFQIDIKPTARDEVGLLTNSFVDMGKGLEERDKVKNILGNMVDPVVVKEAMIDLQALKRGSEKQITSFFSDVASFSTISEKLSSVELAALLNEYLSAMTIILKNHEGVLDKYIGDAIVGIFNAPVDVKDHPLAAARASVEMISKLGELREYWTKNNLYIPEAQAMNIRIGLNSGPAKVGFMGTDALASYTMMGDTVNLAARLEAAGKDYGVDILISESTKKQIEGEMVTKFLDLVRVKGKNEPVQIYQLICKKTEVSKKISESSEIYQEAFQLYLNREWEKSISRFEESVKAGGKKDKSAELLIDRCNYYKENPPGREWDGVFTRKHK
ncbi:MAG: HAMP domain-containing protein [Leptospiraceae bacterium]|nr:HAMP domain-containing protein [Leptospiraceae bacterium]MCP5493753.1 HAMP domain-containing protein [Leptospiraceae bacterium]